MALLGDLGLKKVAETCYSKAQYTAKEISKIKGFSLFCKDYNFIKEFAVKTEYPIDLIIDNARKEKIGLSSVQESNDMLLIAVTEKRTIDDIDTLISFLKRQSIDLQ